MTKKKIPIPVQTGNIPTIQPILLPAHDLLEQRLQQFQRQIDQTKNPAVLQFWIVLTQAQIQALNRSLTHHQQADSAALLAPLLTVENLTLVLQNLIQALQASIPSKSLQVGIQALQEAESMWLNYAEQWLDGQMALVPPLLRPFLGAALQVLFYKHTQYLQVPAILKFSQQYCPVCGMPPLASTLDPENHGLRYLSCSLCETRWHAVRSKCYACESNGKVELVQLQDQSSLMQTESCPDCKLYIKHLDRSKQPLQDLFVEDLATLALDFALAEEGKHRASSNFYLG